MLEGKSIGQRTDARAIASSELRRTRAHQRRARGITAIEPEPAARVTVWHHRGCLHMAVNRLIAFASEIDPFRLVAIFWSTDRSDLESNDR